MKPVLGPSRFRLLLFTLILMASCLAIAAISVTILYRTSMEQQSQRLQAKARIEARMIEAIHEFNVRHRTDYPGGPLAATLAEVIRANEAYIGFGRTGEFMVGRLDRGMMDYLLHKSRKKDLSQLRIPFEGRAGEPMRRALRGESGLVIAEDYAGEMVLGAYEPVAGLGWGVVAKIDLGEAREPFVRAIWITGCLSLIIILAGTGIFFLLGEPLVRQLESHNRALEEQISARRAADRQAAESQDQYRAVVEQAADAILIADAAGRLAEVNPAGCRLLGQSLEALRTRAFADLLDEEGRAALPAALDTLSRGEAAFLDCRIQGEAGRLIAVSISARRLANGHLLGIIHDLTGLKNQEAERLEFERRLQQTQRLESLGVMAGGVAHDFNNLLVGILGNAELAQLDLPSENPAQDNLKAIVGASNQAADLCRQMLAYSGKGKFVIQAVNLVTLVEEIAHLVEVAIPKNTVIRYQFGSPEPVVVGDVSQIRQVIMNLITNAAEAIQGRSGVITLAASISECDADYLTKAFEGSDLPPGRYAALEVSDTGTGMDPETRKRIFDPFFTTKFTGRGLGLAAVQGIVRGHKGAIRVYSEPGQGTTFKILLPLAPDGEGTQAATAAAGPALYAGSGTILIVDDEDWVRQVAGRALERAGFEVVTAADGREGVRLFEECRDRLVGVLLDLTMPKLDGVEAFRLMRQIRADVPVILTSGYNEQDAINRFAGKGLAAFIQKPFLPTALVARFKAVLDRQGPA